MGGTRSIKAKTDAAAALLIVKECSLILILIYNLVRREFQNSNSIYTLQRFFILAKMKLATYLFHNGVSVELK